MAGAFKVGRFTCELALRPDRQLEAKWTPDVPRKLSKKEWQQYRAGRDAFLKKLGVSVMVIEL
jgi:hypothetical protein